MPKFSGLRRAANILAPIRSNAATPDAFTHEGGLGFTRDAKSELFLLAVTNMVAEDTFYERARDRDRRFAAKVALVSAEDPAWIAAFVPFLRRHMHMRSASVVLAAQSAHARLGARNAAADDAAKPGVPSIRSIIASALERADEPAEMLGYWHQTFGRRVPQPVKRGIADAVGRLYNERSALRYDGASRAYRMADVIDLVHPEPSNDTQSALFRWLLDRRHGREDIAIHAAVLPVIAARAELERMPLDERRRLIESDDAADRLAGAGASWEWVSGWLNGPMDARAWEAVIPSMGYMALLRNLRNFDEAAVSGAARDRVNARLQDPDEVARSRQLPLRFYSAFKNTNTLTYATALERGLELSLRHVPSFGGRTLVLVDVSGSMAAPMSNRSQAQRWEIAALFGAAVASRSDAVDLVAFQSQAFPIKAKRGESVLRLIERFKPHVGGGTETFQALRSHYKDHDRVVILTDEQAFYDPASQLSAEDIKAPIYTFNLAGYEAGHLPSGELGRYTFGGLTDQGFAAISLIERGRDADWADLFKLPVSDAEPDQTEEAEHLAG